MKAMTTFLSIIGILAFLFLTVSLYAVIKANINLRHKNRELVNYAIQQDAIIGNCAVTVCRCKELTDKLRPELLN